MTTFGFVVVVLALVRAYQCDQAEDHRKYRMYIALACFYCALMLLTFIGDLSKEGFFH